MGKGSRPRKQRNDTAYKDGWERIYGNQDEDRPGSAGDLGDAGAEDVDDEAAEEAPPRWCCRPQIP